VQLTASIRTTPDLTNRYSEAISGADDAVADGCGTIAVTGGRSACRSVGVTVTVLTTCVA
jgi:hypothetical protein